MFSGLRGSIYVKKICFFIFKKRRISNYQFEIVFVISQNSIVDLYIHYNLIMITVSTQCLSTKVVNSNPAYWEMYFI